MSLKRSLFKKLVLTEKRFCLRFSDLAKDTFIIENIAEADHSRVGNQQLEYPYGNVCPNTALLFSAR